MGSAFSSFMSMFRSEPKPTLTPVLRRPGLVSGPTADERYNSCYAFTEREEGGLSDRPLKEDPGGITNRGITLRFARSMGTMFDLDKDGDVDRGDILLITPDNARMAFRASFWHDIHGDDIWAGLDLTLFDFAINSGASRAIRSLQKVANLKVDGFIGPKTKEAMLKVDGRELLLVAINAERKRFMSTLANFHANPGWYPRVDRVLARSRRMLSGETSNSKA